MNKYALATTSESLPTIAPEMQDVSEYFAASIAPATKRAYRACAKDFSAWCELNQVRVMPASPETVARYLASLAKGGKKVATIQQRLAAIRWAHETHGYDSPTAAKGVRATMAGIRRQIGVAPKRKAPATAERIGVMASHCPDTLKGKRDKALLLFGFASAMRRSELVALAVDDIDDTTRGLLVTLRRSKTDQEGHGHQRAVPFGRRLETCPVEALNAWTEASGVSEGRVFRSVDAHENVGQGLSTRAVADIVKHYAKRSGLDPAEFAGHSLRAGFVTSASEKGATAERIMDHTGHKSVAMVRAYTRRVDAFKDHAGDGLL